MGALIYGPAGTVIEFDDRTLAHLQIVIVGKLRRQESFCLTYDRGAAHGQGRETVWLNPSISIRFQTRGDRGSVNRVWLDVLARSAATGDLIVTSEPAPATP